MALNDLNQMFSIVDPETGRPTTYLMRLLRDRGITSDNLVQSVSELDAALTALTLVVENIDGTVFTAGFGLDGGGTLGADDPITFSLDASIDNLTDVDTSTTPPTDGQALLWSNADSEWQPGDVAAGVDVEDDAVGVVTAATILNFAGAGVVVTDAGGGQADITIAGGGGGGGGGGEPWELITSVTASGANVDIDVSGYMHVVVVAQGLTTSGTTRRRLYASTDGGSTFYTSSGDYIFVVDGGAQTNTVDFMSSDSTSGARSIIVNLPGISVDGSLKTAFRGADGAVRTFVADTSPITDLRLAPESGTFTGGIISVMGIPIASGGGGGGGGGGSASVMTVVHRAASGAGGGVATINAWTTRPMTNEQVNEITGASLASNTVTLPAGTYRVRASAKWYRTNRTHMRLRDITNSTTLLLGSNTFTTATDADSVGFLEGTITLAGTTDIELQYYATATGGGTNDLGVSTTGANGEASDFAAMTFEEVAASGGGGGGGVTTYAYLQGGTAGSYSTSSLSDITAFATETTSGVTMSSGQATITEAGVYKISCSNSRGGGFDGMCAIELDVGGVGTFVEIAAACWDASAAGSNNGCTATAIRTLAVGDVINFQVAKDDSAGNYDAFIEKVA